MACALCVPWAGAGMLGWRRCQLLWEADCCGNGSCATHQPVLSSRSTPRISRGSTGVVL